LLKLSHRDGHVAEAPAVAAKEFRVFISYSRDDALLFADQLVDALDASGFSPVIDRHGIAGGVEWEKRLSELIAQCDAVVFALSPKSVSSSYCQWEVGETDRLRKRLIPIVCIALGDALVPQRLKDLNYIFFCPEPKSPGSGFGAGLKKLVAALKLDPDWERDQTRYSGLGASWEAGGRPENRLLSGGDIGLAKDWLERRPHEMPEPTELVRDFIKASEAAEEARSSAELHRLAERERLVREAEAAQVRTRRLQRRSYAVLALMLAGVIAGLGQVYLFWQRVALNRSEFIASQALGQFNTVHDRVTAELLALEALPDHDSASAVQRLLPFAGTAQQALHDAYRNYTNETWTERRPLSGHTNSVTAVVFSPDAKLVLTGSEDNTARLWQAADGTPVATLSGHTNSVTAVAFSPDGKLVLTGSGDNTARLWQAADGTPVATLSGHTNSVTAVAFSPDGKLALTGSNDNTARLWRAADGTPVATLSGHSDLVWAVTFSPDAKLVLTGSRDNRARLWQTSNGTPVATLSGHSGPVMAVAFSLDGKLVLTGSTDNTVRLWQALPTQSLIREAKSMLPRCLTPDQRQKFHLVPAAPRWCHIMNLWPYDDHSPPYTPGAQPPYGPLPLTWDERLAAAWDGLAFWARTPRK
jgi:TIR domain-containing protein/WD40 domain-containing protein